MSDDRVQQVIDELDPTPASEVAWPVSRRQTLRALAAVGLVGAGSGSASAESAGGVIADEAFFSNYGSESVSDGWELTIDDDVFALTEGDTETIGLPDGAVGEEVVTPGGVEASQVVAPDGTVVFEGDVIPDSAIAQYQNEDFANPWPDNIGNADLDVVGLSRPDVLVEGDGQDDHAAGLPPVLDKESWGLAFTINYEDGDFGDGGFIRGFVEGESFSYLIADPNIRVGLRDNSSNSFAVETNNSYGNGTTRAVVINKPNDNPNDLDIFVDDMGESVASSVNSDGGFDHTNTSTINPSLFARNDSGSFDRHFLGGIGVFEINDEPYSQSEREDFISRRSEL